MNSIPHRRVRWIMSVCCSQHDEYEKANLEEIIPDFLITADLVGVRMGQTKAPPGGDRYLWFPASFNPNRRKCADGPGCRKRVVHRRYYPERPAAGRQSQRGEMGGYRAPRPGRKNER